MEPKCLPGSKYVLNTGLGAPANTADSIPTLKTTLVSNSKLADAGYTTIFDKNRVNIYDEDETKRNGRDSIEKKMEEIQEKFTGINFVNGKPDMRRANICPRKKLPPLPTK